MKKSRQMDLTRGSVIKGILLFAIPYLIGNLFQEFYTITDSLIVGNFCDPSALAAIGSAESPSRVLLNVFMGFSTGTSILISQYYGAGDERKMTEVTRTSNGLLLCISVPLTLICVLFSRTVMGWIRVEEGVAMESAVTYMQILMLGTPAMMGYNQNAGILRGMGDSQSPLLFLILSSVINVVLDYILVGPLQMGIGGAAAATVFAQMISWICSIYYIKRQYPKLQYKTFTYRLDWSIVKELARIGLPLGLNSSIFALGQTMVAAIVNGYGTTAMAGYTCARRLDTLVVMPLFSINNAVTAFVGQNAGARKMKRIKEGIRWGLIMGVAENAVLSIVVILFRNELVALFNDDPQVIAAGATYLLQALPFYVLFAAYTIWNGAMNGAKSILVPTISSTVMFWGVRLPLMFLFNFSGSLSMVYWAFPASWIVGFLISGIYFMTGRWKRPMNLA